MQTAPTRPPSAVASGLAVASLFGGGAAVAVAILAAHGAFAARAAAPATAPATAKPAGEPRRVEVVGYVQKTDADEHGRPVIWVTSEPPEKPTRSAGGLAGGWAAATAVLNAPRTRCVFDKPPPIRAAQGQPIRISGMLAGRSPAPGETPVVEHCEVTAY
ncbi:MAG TPA: hypothetical protein VGF55_31875 [Gemmataceae bacterium]